MRVLREPRDSTALSAAIALGVLLGAIGGGFLGGHLSGLFQWLALGIAVGLALGAAGALVLDRSLAAVAVRRDLRRAQLELGRRDGSRVEGDEVDSIMELVHNPEAHTAVRSDVADVQLAASRFGTQYRFFRNNDLMMPTLQAERGVPVAVDIFSFLEPVVLDSISRKTAIDLITQAKASIAAFGNRSSMRYAEYSPDRVAEFFQEGVRGFLTTRFQFLGLGNGGGGGLFGLHLPDFGGGDGFKIKIHTRVSGLRVHYSLDCGFLRPTYLGAPTTPLSTRIKAGRWSFGVDGGDLAEIKWDPGSFLVPGPTSEFRLNLP